VLRPVPVSRLWGLPPPSLPAYLSDGAWAIIAAQAQLLDHCCQEPKHGQAAVEQLVGLQAQQVQACS
jgi:hypothetical protein